MSESAARAVVTLLGAYVGAGVVFAIPFVLLGAARIDASAKGAPWGFRLLILPGSAALWPWLLARWASGKTEPPLEHDAHADAATSR
jgi:hypothetical protein